MEGSVSGGVNDFVRSPITTTNTGKLEAPKNIINNVNSARTIYFHYRQEHLKRIDLYAAIEGLIAGNPPYNPIELAQAGLSHITNYNNLDGRTFYEKAAQAYWNLLNESEYIAKFVLRGNVPELLEFNDVISGHFNDVVRMWPSFQTQVNTLTAQLVKFGVSPVIWSDERDWRWRTIELQRFFVQDQALTDIEQLTCVCVETTYTVQYLYEVYEEFSKDSKLKSAWNIEQLGKYLVYRANAWAKTNISEGVTDMMDLQRRLQDGDMTFNAIFTDNVRLVSMLMKEYDGKFSHYMFDRWWNDTNDFLYFFDRQYNDIQEFLQLFTVSPGEFTIFSNRGVGHKVFAPCQASMQLDCTINDMARWSGTPLIKSLSTGSRDAEQIRFTPGAPTNIGTAEFVNNTIGANIEQLVGAAQYVLNKTNTNIANSGDDPGYPDRSQGSISPTQAKQMSYKEFSVLKLFINHFYSQFDFVIKNMAIKMLKCEKGYPGYEYAKEWKDRCIEDGVPKEIFSYSKERIDFTGLPRQFKSIKASRVAGDGSTVGRIMGLQELMQIAGSFGVEGQREFQREWVRATMGTEYISVFVPPSEEIKAISDGATIAGLENAVMKGGESPVFSPDNDHRAHIATHMSLFDFMIKSLTQKQMSPIEADTIFNVGIPHTLEHIEALKGNPFAQVFLDGIKKAWDQVYDYARLNRKNAAAMLQKQIEDQQKAEEQQQKVMTDAEREDFKAMRDEERKDFKVLETVKRAKEASDLRATVKQKEIEDKAQNDRLKIQLDNNNKMMNNAKEEENDAREALDDMAGITPSPFDIE